MELNKRNITGAITLMALFALNYFWSQIMPGELLIEFKYNLDRMANPEYNILTNAFLFAIEVVAGIIGILISGVLLRKRALKEYEEIAQISKPLSIVFSVLLLINTVFIAEALISPGYYIYSGEGEETVDIPFEINVSRRIDSNQLRIEYIDHQGLEFRKLEENDFQQGVENQILRKQHVETFFNEETGKEYYRIKVIEDEFFLNSTNYEILHLECI